MRSIDKSWKCYAMWKQPIQTHKHTVWSHLYEMSRTGDSTDTAQVSGCLGVWGVLEKWEVTANRYGISFFFKFSLKICLLIWERKTLMWETSLSCPPHSPQTRDQTTTQVTYPDQGSNWQRSGEQDNAPTQWDTQPGQVQGFFTSWWEQSEADCGGGCTT